jgi:purine-nucleoside phosphorylase
VKQSKDAGQTTLTLPLYEQLQVAVSTIKSRLGKRRPTLGLVLGSGLGVFADQLRAPAVIEYGDIPQFPVSAVEGHAGRLVVGDLGGVGVCAMQGRVHYYEGHEIAKVVFPIRALILCGIKTFIITNAAGAVNPSFAPGDLVLISDHLNLFPENPLRGTNDARLGPRFPDMTQAYAPALRGLAEKAAKKLGISLRHGIYAGLPGPSYETPAEVHMVRALGADLVGMSTVPEVIAANHMGARVLGISCVTNLAAGLGAQKLSHDEVTETAYRVQGTFARLLGGIIAALAQEKA